MTDGRGVPLAAEVTAGQESESVHAESVIAWALTNCLKADGELRVPGKLLGDKGYSVERLQEWLKRRRLSR